MLYRQLPLKSLLAASILIGPTGVLMTAPGPTEKPDPGFSRIFPGFPGTFDWEPKSDPASTNSTPETNRQIGNLYSAVASP